MTAHIPDALAAAVAEWFRQEGWDAICWQDGRDLLAHLAANHAETLRRWVGPVEVTDAMVEAGMEAWCLEHAAQVRCGTQNTPDAVRRALAAALATGGEA